MYIPNLSRDKNTIEVELIYDKEIIAKIIYLYLTRNIKYDELEMLTFKNDFKGYRALEILKYVGLRDVHKELFKNKKITEILRVFKDILKTDNQFTLIYQILASIDKNIYDTVNDNQFVAYRKFELKKASKEISKVINKDIELDSNELEAYYNVICKIRNAEIQRKFRKNLIEEFGCKCALCEINKPKLLVASHIIPYSRCNSDLSIAGDPQNGLLLCKNHDALFEMGNYISFDHSGRIKIAKDLEKECFIDLKISENTKLESKFLTEQRLKYLKVHLRNFLKV